jgi:acetylornithine deacetylase
MTSTSGPSKRDPTARARASHELEPATVTELLADLVAIDSVNPDLVPGAAGERKIAAYVAGWLREAGLDVEVEEAAPGRPNVVAVARGSGGGRSLILNAHLDTVGTQEMVEPFLPRVENGRLYGRGAFDMKSGLAAAMVAAAHAARKRLSGDVIMTAVCDEEYASIGSQCVAARRSADACIITEPTALKVCIAHKGFAWAKLQVLGRAAHGSRPDLGADAIIGMSPVLDGIRQLNERLAETRHPLLGAASVHASTIEGGQELSSYPAACTLHLERRTLPDEAPDAFDRELADLERAAADPASGLTTNGEVLLRRAPFAVDPDEPIVRELARCAEQAVGEPVEMIGEHGWMDAALFAAARIPTVIFGPTGEGAHAAVEYVDLESVVTCARVVAATAAAFCA